MLRRCGLLVVLTLLVLMAAGCDPVYSSFHYTYENGKKIPCNWNALQCGNSSYEDYGGKTYHCTALQCDEAYPVTLPQPSSCSPNYVYDTLNDKGQSWKVVDHEVNQNNASTPVQVTFTSETATTVTVTDELGVTLSAKGSVGVIEAGVEAHINHSVSISVAVTVGNGDTFTIPPGETAYANYGVKVQVTSGHFYDKAKCEGNKSDWGTDITYVPIAAGWCVWTSDQSPCPSI